MAESVQPFDLITMGRIGVDLYPLQSDVPPARAQTPGQSFQGSAAQVAVAAARLGRSTTVITRTGDELDYFAIRAARIFWITGTGLSEEPSRSATLAALKARDKAGITVFDLDWRPTPGNDTAWAGAEEARPYYTEALRHATVVVGTLDACEIATGLREPRACAEALLASGVELAVVKRGPTAVLAVRRDGTVAEVPPAPVTAVEVADGLGAGDAFGGALCHGLLSGWELEQIMRYANAAGATAVGLS
ncbi:PfkB family carbohydrate kinase [Streptomyces sp. NPDC050619]|uniref:PfkB family carbohydrate kinase n=1 Tax=Streptomyces sp. NPDC050619 TaxID=3157214 RepID=UPI00341CADC8